MVGVLTIDDRQVDDPHVGGGIGRQRDGDTPGRREPPQAPSEREHLAENVAERLDVPMVLGVVFVLVVLAETTADPSGALGAALEVLGWLLWGAFVLEFVVRLVVAPSTGAFLRRNWWQVVFLAVPFLRFLRVLRVVRVGRVARLVRIASSAVRSTRSARRALSGRPQGPSPGRAHHGARWTSTTRGTSTTCCPRACPTMWFGASSRSCGVASGSEAPQTSGDPLRCRLVAGAPRRHPHTTEDVEDDGASCRSDSCPTRPEPRPSA